MKILRIFGVVVGVHALALMLIFVNPGCSSANKPAKSPDTAQADENPTNIVTPPEDTAAETPSPVSAAPAESVASADPSGNVGVRFSPTRPGSAAANLIETQTGVSDVTPATTYTVVSGDSLWTIARRNKLTIAELAAANNIKPNATVRIGQKLIIPAKAVSGSSVNMMESTKAPATSQPAARRTSSSVKHVVRSGETLGGIARKYQVRVGEIATANNIADPAKIRPGMELTIPGWQAPGGRRAQTSTPAAPAETPATETPAASAPAGSETQPPSEVPTLIIPPEGETAPATEPPVIRVDEQ